jgi:hypothetical protein
MSNDLWDIKMAHAHIMIDLLIIKEQYSKIKEQHGNNTPINSRNTVSS